MPLTARLRLTLPLSMMLTVSVPMPAPMPPLSTSLPSPPSNSSVPALPVRTSSPAPPSAVSLILDAGELLSVDRVAAAKAFDDQQVVCGFSPGDHHLRGESAD